MGRIFLGARFKAGTTTPSLALRRHDIEKYVAGAASSLYTFERHYDAWIVTGGDSESFVARTLNYL